MSLVRLARRLSAVASEPRPARFLVSRLLWASRLSPLFHIRRNGYALRFYPSSVSALYWTDAEAGAFEERLVRRLLEPGATFVDVGANVGTLTLAGAVAVEPSGRVVSVEAHPRTYRFLRGNIALNGFTQVTAHQCALGATTGEVTFADRRADDMNAVSAAGSGITVPLRRLDDLDTGVGAIGLLKVDVEGFEKFVLEGGERTLARARAVLVESGEVHFQRFGYATTDLLALLERSGFTCLRFVDTQRVARVPGSYTSHAVENLLAARDVPDLLQRTGLTLVEPAS